MADLVDSNHVRHGAKALYYSTLGPLFLPATEQAHGDCVSWQETTQPLGVVIMGLLLLLSAASGASLSRGRALP